eukprot:6556518-Pyramimonas_sp.AAC.2
MGAEWPHSAPLPSQERSGPPSLTNNERRATRQPLAAGNALRAAARGSGKPRGRNQANFM